MKWCIITIKWDEVGNLTRHMPTINFPTLLNIFCFGKQNISFGGRWAVYPEDCRDMERAEYTRTFSAK